MDINSVQSTNPYAANQTAPADNTQLQNRNREAAQAELSQEDARAAREAFQINITQEARDMQAAQAASEPQATTLETSTPATTPAQPEQTAQTGPYGTTGPEASRIMNIVA